MIPINKTIKYKVHFNRKAVIFQYILCTLSKFLLMCVLIWKFENHTGPVVDSLSVFFFWPGTLVLLSQMDFNTQHILTCATLQCIADTLI